VKTAECFGLGPAAPDIPFERVMEYVRSVRQHVYCEADAPPNMERLGVEVAKASARFIDPHSIELHGEDGSTRRVSSRYFVVASGSKSREPRFTTACLTNETLFDLTSQPKRLVVIGAGPVGIEMAQAFQRLGSAVTVVGAGAHILPRDDPELTDMLRKCLAAEGITFILGQRATGLARNGDALTATLEDGRAIACDVVLAAIGREPNVTGLTLQNAGVAAGENGIVIDERCRTRQPHIYAVGDVTGRYQFTHMAEHMSKVAVTNAILRWPKKLDDKHLIWTTFTDPQLARLGGSEAGAIYRLPFTKIDRAVTDGETAGLIKVTANSRGRILGASILGANAGDMIAEYALAMRNGLRLSQIANTIHPYPTFALGNRQAADEWYSKKLGSPLLRLFAKLLRYRGRPGTPIHLR
ncbi:MAG: dihydrolipoyl dehydrogenase family protein, partial [Candidatus Acidiferrales bacterium]